MKNLRLNGCNEIRMMRFSQITVRVFNQIKR